MGAPVATRAPISENTTKPHVFCVFWPAAGGGEMRTSTVDQLQTLQRTPRSVRNVCVLAHVDHGKTSLVDSLVASNGIISAAMAGRLR